MSTLQALATGRSLTGPYVLTSRGKEHRPALHWRRSASHTTDRSKRERPGTIAIGLPQAGQATRDIAMDQPVICFSTSTLAAS